MDGYGRYILAITEDIHPQRGDASGNRYTGDGVVKDKGFRAYGSYVRGQYNVSCCFPAWIELNSRIR